MGKNIKCIFVIEFTKQKESQKNKHWKNKPGFICFSLIMGA